MSPEDGCPQTSGEGREGSEHTLGIDDVFAALTSHRRRIVVRALSQQPDGVATVDDLVDEVLALEDDLEEQADNHRERVVAALVHEHLPRLDDLGIVEYDRRSRTVRFRAAAAVEEWIEHAAALTLPDRSPR